MAIPALDGVDRLVGVLDALATTPPRGRDLPVLLVEDDPGGPPGSAAAFVTGYQQRLLDDARAGVIPHAILDGAMAAAAARSAEPDVELLDRITERLRGTMPRRAGRLALPRYDRCREVLRAEVGVGVPGRQRDRLGLHLVAAWQRDRPVLRLLRAVLDLAEGKGAVALAAKLVKILPVTQIHLALLGRSRYLRWYTEHVSRAGQPSRDFLSAAVHLGTQGLLRDNAALRQKLLLEALGRDLEAAARRGRFRHRHRRRTWAFVLLVCETGGAGSQAAHRIVEGWQELTGRLPGLPVLAIAAQRPTDPADGEEPGGPRRTADAIQRTLHDVPTPAGRARARRPKRVFRMRFPAEPPLEAVKDWLDTNVEVQPERAGWFFTFRYWLVLGTVLAGVAVAGAAARPLLDQCQREWKTGGEIVGVDDSEDGCYFTPDDPGSMLYGLQRKIHDQNREAVDSGRYRTVVFLSPLTTDPGKPQQLLPAGVLQLRGAAQAQLAANQDARIGSTPLRIRLVVANTGFEFRRGTEVVAKLTDLAAKDPSVSAVIGISQSRAESVDALGKLPTDLAVIGANTTGHFMLADLPRYFATQPTDAELASAMVADAASRGFSKAMVIADDHDGYSRELHGYLGTELARRKIAVVPQPFEFRSADAYLDQVTSQLPDLAAKLCALTRAHGAVFYTARGDYLPKLLVQVELAACGVPVPMIAGDISHLVEYEGTPEYARVNRFHSVVFDYVAFSEHSDAEQATGSDALRAAAAAISQAAMVTGADSVRASNVLQRLIGGLVVSGERRFTIDAATRAPKDRQTMFLCRPKPTGVGSGECHRPPIVPLNPMRPASPVSAVPSPP
ncbi:MAG: hypothetical protein JWO79_2577 [Actinomycetia bacterium]|nr:hypothetical protein [Actinomycetes bacterium]